MPLVKFYLRKGTSPEFRRILCDQVHQALVAQANVPADDQFQIVNELDPESLVAHPSYGSVSRSERVIIIEITLNTGRTLEIKKSLYADIVRRLERQIAVRTDDVVVLLVEVAKENWSFGKGIATYG